MGFTLFRRGIKQGASRWRLSSVQFACVFLSAVCSLLPAAAYAARIYPSAGSTSAAFLKLGVGARAAAMGGAFTAVPGDPYAVYWNPAGLARLDDGKNVGFFHNEYFQGLGQEFLFYTAPAAGFKIPLAGRPRGGAFGLGLNYFYTPKEMERRSGLNEADPVNPISPVEGKFGAYDVAFSAGYGWQFRRDIALGAAFKVIRQSIDDRSGSSAALDLGLLRGFDWKGEAYTAGVSVQNIGPGIKFTERRYPLPLVFKAGLSRRLPGRGGLVALEAAKPVDNYLSFLLGVEYPLTGRLALRSGYRYRMNGNELGPWSGFSAGAGVEFDRLSFDYAFAPFGGLGDSHRFSVNFRFGEAAAPVKQAAAPAQLMPGAKAFIFKSSPRALAISQRGIKYEVKAAAADCGLYGITFRTLVRGEVPAEFSVWEGELPAELLKFLPAGFTALKAWQLPTLPGQVQGGVKLEFKLPKAAAPDKMFLLFRAADGWREAEAAPAGGGNDFSFFAVEAPLSTHYALAVKE